MPSALPGLPPTDGEDLQETLDSTLLTEEALAMLEQYLTEQQRAGRLPASMGVDDLRACLEELWLLKSRHAAGHRV